MCRREDFPARATPRVKKLRALAVWCNCQKGAVGERNDVTEFARLAGDTGERDRLFGFLVIATWDANSNLAWRD